MKTLLLTVLCAAGIAVFAAEREEYIAAAYEVLEVLSRGEEAEITPAELEKQLLEKYPEAEKEPVLQCALGMISMQQAITSEGEGKKEFLNKAVSRLYAANNGLQDEFADLSGIELARAWLLQTDIAEGDVKAVSALCRKAFALLNGLESLSGDMAVERDRLLFAICLKTGFFTGAEGYRRRIAEAGGDISDLVLPEYSVTKVADKEWSIKENNSNGVDGYFIEDTAHTFAAFVYMLPAEVYGGKENLSRHLEAFAAPVLAETLEGRLAIMDYSANGSSGIYAIVTDKSWKPGDEKRGSRQFVTLALLESAEKNSNEILYLVLYSDFAASEDLAEILIYCGELLSGR